MNMQTSNVMAPPAPKTLESMALSPVMMRDILIKTMYRTNLENVAAIAKFVVDSIRDQRMVEATGTLNANNGNEMGYQLTDAGKQRALDALAQSEYYGAMPVPLEVYSEQVERQSIKNIQVTREQLVNAMGHLILPPDLLSQLGPAVYRSLLCGRRRR